MTLVVARANAAGLRILTDSRASYVSRDARRPHPDPRPCNPLEGVLKVVLLNHSQCVAFAGDVTVAYDTIHSIVRDQVHLRLDDEVVLARLRAAHVGSGAATDFILGSVLHGARLCEVRNGTISRDVPAAWLGNQDAFAEYQRHYLAVPDSPPAADPARDALSRMMGAMNALLEGERTFDDVGDFLIRVGSEDHGLVYMPNASAAFPPWEATSTHPTTVDMGSAATGAYSYAVLCPVDAGVPLVAVYIAHGGFGVVFLPFHAREPLVIDAATAQAFVEHVEVACGRELSGFVPLRDGILRIRRHKPARPPDS